MQREYECNFDSGDTGGGDGARGRASADVLDGERTVCAEGGRRADRRDAGSEVGHRLQLESDKRSESERSRSANADAERVPCRSNRDGAVLLHLCFGDRNGGGSAGDGRGVCGEWSGWDAAIYDAECASGGVHDWKRIERTAGRIDCGEDAAERRICTGDDSVRAGGRVSDLCAGINPDERPDGGFHERGIRLLHERCMSVHWRSRKRKLHTNRDADQATGKTDGVRRNLADDRSERTGDATGGCVSKVQCNWSDVRDDRAGGRGPKLHAGRVQPSGWAWNDCLQRSVLRGGDNSARTVQHKRGGRTHQEREHIDAVRWKRRGLGIGKHAGDQ